MKDVPTEDLRKAPWNGEFGRWRIKKFAGKHRHQSQSGAVSVIDTWLCQCQCPHKTRRVIPKGNLVNGLSTQCKACASDARRKGDRPHMALWRRIRRESCPAWRDETVFGKYWAKRTARHLVRKDSSKPYSPRNCFWSKKIEKGLKFNRDLAALRMKVLGESQKQADTWVATVTHQRRHQWWDVNCGDDERRTKYKEQFRKQRRNSYRRAHGIPIDQPLRQYVYRCTKPYKKPWVCEHGLKPALCDACKKQRYERQLQRQRDKYRLARGIPLDKPVGKQGPKRVLV